MKALFGVVSLLVVLAIVGVLASRQLKAVQPAVSGASASASAPETTAVQARQVQDKVRNDIADALRQGTEATRNADK